MKIAFFILAVTILVGQGVGAQQTPPPTRFGDAYSLLEPRRQQLVDAWVAGLAEVTGQKLEAGPFYDDIISLSAKTTFDAVTHALMTTPLTDASGGRIGDALDVIQRVESVRGEVAGASGDRQFRMYVRLVPDAIDTLSRSREFRRGMDNSIYHKGYPLNYRQQGGVPSIQISIATDRRRADIDVDYRSSMFPVSMFNGHLSSSNSDVRAGNNSDRHDGRWAGLQNWWRGFFGVRTERPAQDEPVDRALVLPKTPRAGSKNIDVMVHDFLQAWLVEGDARTAMGYVSDRAYACMAQDADDPSDFNRGLAPFQLMNNLKAAYDALGKHDSLVGLTVGVRLTRPALKVVQQPHHAQFVIYAVPDDVAAEFDCESRLSLGDARNAKRTYGHYFGSTFYVNGRTDSHVALLWARENGYWKLVSWRTGGDDDVTTPEAAPEVNVVRIAADSSLVQAARGFLESWWIRRDYDAAFRYLSPKSYACYNLARGPDAPPSTSQADAGAKIRASLERAGQRAGTQRSLDALISSAEPFHPSIRVMNHRYQRTFSLASIPNALADAAECDARASGAVALPDPIPPEYGQVFEETFRFRTKGGDTPTLRLMWRKEDNAWRITAYAVEAP